MEVLVVTSEDSDEGKILKMRKGEQEPSPQKMRRVEVFIYNYISDGRPEDRMESQVHDRYSHMLLQISWLCLHCPGFITFLLTRARRIVS